MAVISCHPGDIRELLAAHPGAHVVSVIGEVPKPVAEAVQGNATHEHIPVEDVAGMPAILAAEIARRLPGLRARLAAGQTIVFHCRSGIARAPAGHAFLWWFLNPHSSLADVITKVTQGRFGRNAGIEWCPGENHVGYFHEISFGKSGNAADLPRGWAWPSEAAKARFVRGARKSCASLPPVPAGAAADGVAVAEQ